MLAVQSDYLQVAHVTDVAVLIIGGACFLAYVLWLLSSGRWRNPLAGVEGTGDAPGLVHVLIVLLLYFGTALGGMFLTHGDSRAAPGTRAWHVAQNADALGRLVAAAVAVWILRRRPSFVPPAGAGRRWRVLLATGLVGTFVVLAMCAVQYEMSTILWRWQHPEQTPPVHQVLLAVQNTQWGWWGRAQLVVGAVVVAPLAEELFFRGLVLGAVWRYLRHAWLAVLTSGLAFGAIHAQPQDILPLCTLGIVLGYLRTQTRSLVPCLIVHALFNARTMSMALFFPQLIRGT